MAGVGVVYNPPHMTESINVTIAMPLDEALVELARNVSPRVSLTHLSRSQRFVYRDGRALWGGYREPPAAEDESEEEARKSLYGVLGATEVLLSNQVLPEDIVVRAMDGVSGRLERCIPIGELRDRAYRVRSDILKAWGGLSVKDGYIQRSVRPPEFLQPERFYRWFLKHEIPLLRRNN